MSAFCVCLGMRSSWKGPTRLVGLATTVACLLCTAVPVLMVMMAIERIGTSLAAQTGMVGPISTILMGVVILGEPFTVCWVAAGTVLVIAGIFVFASKVRVGAS